MKIPAYVSCYLWDVQLDKISVQEDAGFIIERVLEYGDEKALEWINKNYQRSEIIKVLVSSKKISPKTGNFYALYYQIPKEKILCIQKPFSQKQNRF